MRTWTVKVMEVEMLEPGKKFAVFSIRQKDKRSSIWVRAGNAVVNRDGSMNLWLDVLPLDGVLHVREAGERRDSAPASTEMAQPLAAAAPEAAAMGGH